ncbi:hypothetical protein HBH56_198910 [Parastagonospora nodorum]|uniref:Uncharacterized protein n=1 Tax=Phaeosphaeria nodorum (strain SN15 / ATCC MYA-4574 / FGSC 10173) TaxID=321614 RepID=A0A7U2I2S2_PHANO|nr:hypothetical protein HBH56_198910 [Parastagonospora nodorum]QRC97726.1 hypothetical protein JI435_435110 [Parastagonospora nodorum SN15]KAH3924736.1 hypothetical protein HBH54_191870 [Parastagonospora nodorum]KAH3942011.1 hypothetical protein HBH53_193460 [Parastagonospora nodorum]KAH3957804.1 hypothetical protein HBH51_219330 [Parastagonospora nodorum]
MLSSHLSWAEARYQSPYTASDLHVVVEVFVAARSACPTLRCDLHSRTVHPEPDISTVIHVTSSLSVRVRLAQTHLIPSFTNSQEWFLCYRTRSSRVSTRLWKQSIGNDVLHVPLDASPIFCNQSNRDSQLWRPAHRILSKREKRPTSEVRVNSLHQRLTSWRDKLGMLTCESTTTLSPQEWRRPEKW